MAGVSTGQNANIESDFTSIQENKKYIWNYLSGICGLSDMHAAAIMGNIQQESDFSATNAQDSYGYPGYDNTEYISKYKINDGVGWGLLQWTHYTRKQNLLDFANNRGKSVGDFVTQVDFFQHEVNNISPYKTNYQRFLRKSSIEEATQYFCEKIEQAGIPHMSSRIKYAKQLFAEFGGSN